MAKTVDPTPGRHWAGYPGISIFGPSAGGGFGTGAGWDSPQPPEPPAILSDSSVLSGAAQWEQRVQETIQGLAAAQGPALVYRDWSEAGMGAVVAIAKPAGTTEAGQVVFAMFGANGTPTGYAIGTPDVGYTHTDLNGNVTGFQQTGTRHESEPESEARTIVPTTAPELGTATEARKPSEVAAMNSGKSTDLRIASATTRQEATNESKTDYVVPNPANGYGVGKPSEESLSPPVPAQAAPPLTKAPPVSKKWIAPPDQTTTPPVTQRPLSPDDVVSPSTSGEPRIFEDLQSQEVSTPSPIVNAPSVSTPGGEPPNAVKSLATRDGMLAGILNTLSKYVQSPASVAATLMDTALPALTPETERSMSPAMVGAYASFAFDKAILKDYLSVVQSTAFEAYATMATLGFYQMAKPVTTLVSGAASGAISSVLNSHRSHSPISLEDTALDAAMGGIKSYAGGVLVVGKLLGLYDLSDQYEKHGGSNASASEKAELAGHAVLPAIGLAMDLAMARSMFKTGSASKGNAGKPRDFPEQGGPRPRSPNAKSWELPSWQVKNLRYNDPRLVVQSARNSCMAAATEMVARLLGVEEAVVNERALLSEYREMTGNPRAGIDHMLNSIEFEKAANAIEAESAIADGKRWVLDRKDPVNVADAGAIIDRMVAEDGPFVALTTEKHSIVALGRNAAGDVMVLDPAGYAYEMALEIFADLWQGAYIHRK